MNSWCAIARSLASSSQRSVWHMKVSGREPDEPAEEIIENIEAGLTSFRGDSQAPRLEPAGSLIKAFHHGGTTDA